MFMYSCFKIFVHQCTSILKYLYVFFTQKISYLYSLQTHHVGSSEVSILLVNNTTVPNRIKNIKYTTVSSYPINI